MGRFSRFIKVGGIGLLTGTLGLFLSFTPFGRLLEEDYGLGWLFKLRGTVAPPSEVIIVSIDRESAVRLDLPDEPEKWPRSLHAQLITELKAKGVLLTVFNVIFDESRDSADSIMAEAMRDAHNVVLTDYLKRRTHFIRDSEGKVLQRIHQDELVSPIRILNQAAIASAPFLLPKGEITVKRFLPFGTVESLATLPVTVLQADVILKCPDNFLTIIQTALPALAQPLSELYRDIFRSQNIHKLIYALQMSIEQDEQIASKLFESLRQAQIPEHQKQLITALFKVYQRQESRYLNHYGPPKSITTVPYHQAVSGIQPENISFENKIVFVGFSEDLQPERYQGFFTFFTENQRKNVSSVEIAATAFANLLHDKTIREPSRSATSLIIFAWGLIIGLACRVLPISPAAIALTILGAGYLLFCLWQFSTHNIWMPLATPLVLQIPFAILADTFYRYIMGVREKRNIRRNLVRYLPQEVVDSAGEQNSGDNIDGNQRLMYGVCLATDAGQYTALAESLEPVVLAKLMNEYYSVIFRPVEQYNGYVSDVIGDAMLAIWSSLEDGPEIRRNACRAALQIRQVSEDFSRTHGYKLLTRIGLHYGQMLIGNVGGDNRMEFRAVGDTVNTATRIEGLNKTLGTRLLASQDVIAFLSEFHTRELGMFLLAGKSRPVVIHEVLGNKSDIDKEIEMLCSQFSKALALFKENRLEEATEMFNFLVQTYPNDGPSAFYREKTAEIQFGLPEDSWNGIIRVGKSV